MNQRKHTLMVAMVVSFCIILFGLKVQAESDFVYRPEIGFSGPLTHALSWTAAIDPRMSKNAQEADEIGLSAGVAWRQSNYVSYAADVKFISKGGSSENNESRPRFAFELSAPVKRMRVAMRHRFEYRMKEKEDEYWRYRTRIKVTFPMIGKITPFVYEEILYEFGDIDALNRNEAGVGAGLPLAENLKLDIDLRFRNNRKNGGWDAADKHLLTVFKFSL